MGEWKLGLGWPAGARLTVSKASLPREVFGNIVRGRVEKRGGEDHPVLQARSTHFKQQFCFEVKRISNAKWMGFQ
ncbi:hypothetical protein ACLKA6_010833 [Drosophila palustris]